MGSKGGVHSLWLVFAGHEPSPTCLPYHTCTQQFHLPEAVCIHTHRTSRVLYWRGWCAVCMRCLLLWLLVMCVWVGTSGDFIPCSLHFPLLTLPLTLSTPHPPPLTPLIFHPSQFSPPLSLTHSLLFHRNTEKRMVWTMLSRTENHSTLKLLQENCKFS